LLYKLDAFKDNDSRVRRYQHSSTTEERQLLRERIVQDHMGLISYLVHRFPNRGEASDDLIQVGVVGLLGALERFDSSLGIRFISFARPTIIGELRRHFRDKTWAIRLPRSLKERSLEAVSTETSLCQELRRCPTAVEIGERIGASEDQVIEALRVARCYNVLSLDRHVEHDNGETTTIGELRGEVDGRLAEIEELVAVEPATNELPDQDKRLLFMRFYQGMTQNDIALELGVSQMQVSRNLARILNRIRSLVV